MVVHDLLVGAYHSYLLIWALTIPVLSADEQLARRLTVAMFALSIGTIVLVRSELLPAGRFRAALYRLGLIGPIPVTYWQIAVLLKAANPTLLDPQLWAIDRAIFGVTPAEWLVRFNQVAVNEWFAFFYQGYYLVLAVGLFAPPLLDRGRRLQEIMFASALGGTLGQAIYTFVPGYGPHRTMAFIEPVAGGYWWGVVDAMVRLEAAMDVFPSLHTAMPTMFALHAFRHRRVGAYKFLWPVVALFALHMVIATMLLRFHWGIDIIAALAFAIGAHALSIHVANHEAPRGTADERQPVWEPLFRFQRQER